jgi:hypothetical protein
MRQNNILSFIFCTGIGEKIEKNPEGIGNKHGKERENRR